MDYTNWSQIQQNPSPNPNPEYSVLHNPNQSVVYSQNLVSDPYQLLNANSHTTLFHQPQPPGVDTTYTVPPVAMNYVNQLVVFEAQQGVDAAAAAAAAATYYPDPNVTSAAAATYYPDPNVSWVPLGPQYGTASYAVVSVPSPAIQPEMKNIWKKLPKKTKVVQSAWCEVCKIDCNSKGVLDKHKLGKKHLKNLQKLKVGTPTISAPIVAAHCSASVVEPPTSTAAPLASIVTSTSLPVPTPAPTPNPTPASTSKPFIGPLQKSKSQKSRKKAAARIEDLEVKRRKVLEGGAAADAVRACSICNVVCNSDTVFNYHIAGQKHASMAKKLALGAGVSPVV